MTYRVHLQLKNGLSEQMEAGTSDLPKYGDAMSITRKGRQVPVRVVAIWTPMEKPGRDPDPIVVEAREI